MKYKGTQQFQTNIQITGELGAELVTNGSFTGSASGWTLGTGWQYNNNAVDKNVDGTGALTPTSPIAITAGKIYAISFTVTNLTAGFFNVAIGGEIYYVIQTASNTVYQKATTTGNLSILPSNTSRFTIDNISVREIINANINIYGDISLLTNGDLTIPSHSAIRMGNFSIKGDTNIGFYSGGSVMAYFVPGVTNLYGNQLNIGSDATLLREAANILALRSGTSPQKYRVYNTYTNASNYERAVVQWNANTLEIGAEALGTGTLRGNLLKGAFAKLQGGNYVKSVSQSGNYNATISDNLIDINASGGDATVTLPALSTAWDSTNNLGLQLTIVKVDSTNNNLIIDGNASETINGATTQSTNLQWTGFKIQAASATDWRIIT